MDKFSYRMALAVGWGGGAALLAGALFFGRRMSQKPYKSVAVPQLARAGAASAFAFFAEEREASWASR